MTSRLKHKLEIENVNLNSAYLNESFVQIGTPLPALADHKKDKQEYVPEWQQEVRDEQGRRRFHGAFTGGFSAGYYNSVGSKEGWTPSTFKSSRSNRANKVQRAEDFMDEEDLQQLKDDRKLENTDIFKNDGFGGTKEELAGKNLPSTIESLIAPSRTSIGEKLLQKLGWRPGQGIGPRVTLRKLKLQQGKLGKARLGIQDDNGNGKEDQEDNEEIGDEEGSNYTFAPRDVKLLTFEAKEDKQGLGYVKGSGMGSLPGKRPAMGARSLDNDNDDPYAEAGPSSRRLAFDLADDDDDVIMMGGSSRPGLGSRSNKENVGGRQSSGQDTWHDGRPVLLGFALDPKGVPPDKWFVMPDISPDWRPRPARVWGTTKKWDQQPGQEEKKKEVIRGEPGRPLTFEQRGAALGEEQRISKAKSVFDYMSSKENERLASLSLHAPARPPPPLSLEPPPEEAQTPLATEITVPPLSPRTASAALKGFIPYGDDIPRQDRYKSYLASQTYNTIEPNPVLKKGSIEEINKELVDFASSARIFKPMSYAMSNRFTTGSSSLAVSDLKQAKPGLHLYDAEKAKLDELSKPKQVSETQVKKNLTPREQAAKNGMYGKMTRETKNFYPVKLLCRRFGVQDPHPEGDPSRGQHPSSSSSSTNNVDDVPLPKNDASWESKFIYQPSSASASDQNGAPSTKEEITGEKQPTSIAEVGMANDVNQGRDTLTYKKPGIDIFKAIFASDDEDEDDDEENDENAVKNENENRSLANSTNQVVAKIDQVEKYRDPFPVKDEGPVDLSTFKPVFTIRKETEDKSKKEKKKDRSKKRKGVLSFDVGEDGDEEEKNSREEKKKKKKDQDKGKETRTNGTSSGNAKVVDVEAAEGEWVEKQTVVPRLAGRKGAADFM
ncbi:uncharacterized protein IL334_006492 [Kwoniella shivajii]|uniref:G-patch domain-containing protein n=1 Tax=Kwoniella shivajii TaxID=564305 RepID=A0ABZ1D636_9TREE|nr:hypothetical protein IL334_006492 [Kwoniella shivajii]